MSAAQHPTPEDLALFALGSLPPDEAAAIRTHSSDCKECRAEISQLHLDLAHLALDVPAAQPSAGARQRFMARVENEASLPGFRESAAAAGRKLVAMPSAPARNAEKADSISPASRPRAFSLMPWLIPGIVAAVCVLVAVAAGIENRILRERVQHLSQVSQQLEAKSQQLEAKTGQLEAKAQRTEADARRTGVSAQRTDANAQRIEANAQRASEVLALLTAPNVQRVTLTAGKKPPQPTGHASYLRERGQLVFIANNLAALPQGKIYELWLIPVSGGPIPAGTFAPDTQGSASVVFPQLPAGVEAKAFGVTVEPEGGSSAPTSAILLQGS